MKSVILSFFCSTVITCYSQEELWECIKTDGDCCAFAKCITMDGSGNSYVTGWFNSNSIALGVGDLKFPSKRAGGTMSIVKYDSKGNAVWVRGTGSTEDIPALASVTDKDGNSYITGLLESPFDLDPLVLKNRTNMNSANTQSAEMTVVKYDTKGNILWLKKEGANKKSTSIALDKHKNVYVSGFFTGECAIFGPVTLNNADSTEKQFFLVKYDPSGNVIWAKSTAGKGIAETSSIATGPKGNIVVTGSYTGTVSFETASLTSENGVHDVFIVKYDPDGNLIWAKSAGGGFSDYSTCVSIDHKANVYISGCFSGPSMKLEEIALTNKKAAGGANDFNIFVAKYDEDGKILWAKNADNKEYGCPEKLTVASDKAGNCYLAGNFEGGSFAFEGLELNTKCISPTNFIVKLDDEGKLIWLKNVGQTECHAFASFSIDPKHNCRVIVGSPQRFRMSAFKAN